MTEHDDILEENGHDVEVDLEEIRQCAEQLERENAQLNQQLLRLKADFDNYRRRTQSQMEETTKNANQSLLQDLLPILDNFERALSTGQGSQEQDPFFQGINMVYQGLMNTLAGYGLKPIIALGEPFDAGVHEAVAMEGEGDGTLVVLEQIQTGYVFNEKVLRYSKVLVGPNKEEDECQK